MRTLKERLRFIPDAVNIIDVVTTASTPTSIMDTTTAGIEPNLIYFALVNVLGMIFYWISDPD